MSLRVLSSFEKKILGQSVEKKRNGITFAATYSSTSEEWSDDATLSTLKDSRLTLPILTHALKNLISKNIELALTINENMEFTLLKNLKTDDVINVIQFSSVKDEKVNCHAGAPPYLLHHIFNNTTFTPGSNKPLWELYIVDESLLIFHGQDTLFDSFSGANFHKFLLDEINSIIIEGKKISKLKKLEYIFYQNDTTKFTYSLPKSIYDNAKIHLPAKSPALLNLQTQSFFKSIYFSTVKKPFEMLSLFGGNDEDNYLKNLKEYKSLPSTKSLIFDTSLCGTTVFGSISKERFSYLHSLVEHEHICFRSLICGITMLCLKPLVKNFDGLITFSMPVDLRKYIKKSDPSPRNFGLYYKDIRVECPLSLIDDRLFGSENDDYDAKTLNDENSEYTEKLLEHQLKQVTNFVKNVILENIRKFEKFGFDDDDIRRMKYGNTNDNTSEKDQNKIISICDTSDIVLGNTKVKEDSQFNLKNTSFTKSLMSNECMSLCYSYCNDTGLNICIHFPDSYNMESFVECFQSFIDE